MPAIEPEDRYPAVPRLRTTSVVWKRYVALSDGAIDDGVRITGIARFRAADSRHLSLNVDVAIIRQVRVAPQATCPNGRLRRSSRKTCAFVGIECVAQDPAPRLLLTPVRPFTLRLTGLGSEFGADQPRRLLEARPLRRGATPSCSAPTGHTIAGVTRGPARLAARFAPSARQAVMLARTPPGTRGPARGPRQLSLERRDIDEVKLRNPAVTLAAGRIAGPARRSASLGRTRPIQSAASSIGPPMGSSAGLRTR